MPYYTGLARVARRTGYPVIEVPGWKTRGHGPMKGCKTLVAHHTAGAARGDYPSLPVVRDGRAGLAGPLSQFGLGRSGTIYVIAAGLCWHTGETWTTSQSNSQAIGIEAENTGTGAEPWPDVQMDAYVKLLSELCKEFGLPVTAVMGHREIAKPKGRKPDPRGIDLDELRAAVKRGYWKTTTPPKPEPLTLGDGSTAWPENPLPLTDTHTRDSHNAWATLMTDVGYTTGPLGKALQSWLGDLPDPRTGKGYYPMPPYLHDGVMGPAAVKGLQAFLTAKGHYDGLLDGKRGPLTVRAEIAYLNSQRTYYAADQGEADTAKPAPTPAPDEQKEAPVASTDPQTVHQPGIDWAKETGLMVGYTDGTFRPDQPVTRGELATILHRYHEKEG